MEVDDDWRLWMITWLASYPKSGNTWVRLFLEAYLQDMKPDINDIRSSCADTATAFYEVDEKIEVEDLSLAEQMMTRPMAILRINYLFQERIGNKYPVLVKTHNANISIADVKLIPAHLTKKVLLIIRDPRELVYSFARHFGLSLDEAIESICQKDFALKAKKGMKMAQYLMSWSWHIESYINDEMLDVAVVKYEDLLNNPLNTFIWILNQLEIEMDEEKVRIAIERCDVKRMMKQEDEKGFKEASQYAERFFGQKYEERLTREQEAKIVKECGETMRIFNYLEAEEKMECVG